MSLHLGLGDHAELWLEGRIALLPSGGDAMHDVVCLRDDRASRLAPLLGMLDERVIEARAWKDARLEVRFANGGKFMALPSDEGNSWSIRWRDPEGPESWVFSSDGHTLLVRR